MVTDQKQRRAPPLVGIRLVPDRQDSHAREKKPRALPSFLRFLPVAILLASGIWIVLTAKTLDSDGRIVAATGANLVMLSLGNNDWEGEPYPVQTSSAAVKADVVVRLHETISRIFSQVRTSNDNLEAAIAMTGLEAGALLDTTQRLSNGQGGRFVGLDGLGAKSAESAESEVFSAVSELEMNLQRLTGLRQVLRNLPLVPPVESYYVSSRFGKRRDPLTRRLAMHYGVDLSGPLKSPVRSTASGVVTFAGRAGARGKSVEISHGNGVTTSYSHLHKILVKKGQEVPFRYKIGLMGSTGRSTGSHVHYEIRFRGVPQDPAKFIKAGSYAFKTGPAPDLFAARSGDIAADTASDVGSFRVHVASYRLPTMATAGWQQLRRGREDLFDGLGPTTERFDAGSDGGVFYRLLVGPMATLDAAQGLCTKLKGRSPLAWCNPVEVARN